MREERTEDDGALQLLIELPAAQLAALARDPRVSLALLPPDAPCAGGAPYLESPGPVPSGGRNGRRNVNRP